MVKRLVHISYHVIVVLMSAALALSAPFALSAMAAGLLQSLGLHREREDLSHRAGNCYGGDPDPFFQPYETRMGRPEDCPDGEERRSGPGDPGEGNVRTEKDEKNEKETGICTGADDNRIDRLPVLCRARRVICTRLFRIAAKRKSCCSTRLRKGRSPGRGASRTRRSRPR